MTRQKLVQIVNIRGIVNNFIVTNATITFASQIKLKTKKKNTNPNHQIFFDIISIKNQTFNWCHSNIGLTIRVS